jgi:hypothetical protein
MSDWAEIDGINSPTHPIYEHSQGNEENQPHSEYSMLEVEMFQDGP